MISVKKFEFFIIIIIFFSNAYCSALWQYSTKKTLKNDIKFQYPNLKKIPLPIVRNNLSEQEVGIVMETFDYFLNLKTGPFKIPKTVHKEMSVFEKLYGFRFDGKKLLKWIHSRIVSIQKGKTGFYIAVNQNQNLVLGEQFFQLSVLDRAIIFIHEARHSDGNEFRHVRCPSHFNFLSIRKIVKLANTLACDKRLDGAYGLSAAFIFELIAYGLGDQEILIGKYNSEIARIITYKRCILF